MGENILFKMRHSLIILISFLLFSCGNTADTSAKPETSVDNSQNIDVERSEVSHFAEMARNTDKLEEKEAYLKQALNSISSQDRPYYEETLLAEIIKANPKNTSDELLELANIYESKGKKEIAGILYRGFKTRFPNDPRNKDIAHKRAAEAEVHPNAFTKLLKSVFGAADENGFNEEKAREYIDRANAFGLGFAGDENIPEYLMICADLARALGDTHLCIGEYDWLHNYYPDHPKASLAMFLKAYEIDGTLRQFDDAKKEYEAFLKKYPNDPLAKDVKFLIENIGKSPDASFKEMEYLNPAEANK